MTTETEQSNEINEIHTAEDAAKKEATKRIRRVTTRIKLPEGESTVGTISLHITGRAEPYVHEVDFSTLPQNVLQAAALAGIANKFAIAYAGEKDHEAIVKVVEAEIAELEKGEFTSRTLREKVTETPDIIIAWMNAVNADAADKEVVAKYVSSWNAKTLVEREPIINNGKVIKALDDIVRDRRLAKKLKDAVTDDDALAL